MATTEVAKFKNSDLIPIPQPPDYYPTTTVSPSHDDLHFWQFMIAGSIAGMVEHMAMFKIDTIKTRMQVLGSCPIKSVSLRQAVNSILKFDGPTGLYREIEAMGLNVGPAHAAYFIVYEMCKEKFSRRNPNNPAAHATTRVVVTVASDAMFTPMDMVKQRLQLGSGIPYKGVVDCVRVMLREDKVGGGGGSGGVGEERREVVGSSWFWK